MALGIPLSSLDVVVGISGVHYVLQGLRQIDRELSAANNKKVRTALDFPDPSGQLRQMRDAFGQTTVAVTGLGTATRETFAALRQPVANPFRQAGARGTIQDYNNVRQQVTLLRREADLASRDFQRANRALNDFLRAERPQQRIVDASGRLQQQITDRIMNQRTRDFDSEIRATASGQRWFQRGSAADLRNIDLARDARRQQQANVIARLQQDLRDEQARAAAAQAFLTSRSGQRGFLQNAASTAQGVLGMRNAELGAAETHLTGLTRAAALARQYLQATAGFLNPIQWIGGVLRGFMGFIPVLANMGMGLLKVGGAAVGAVGHLGAFGLKVLQLPVIAGPLTGGLSLIAENFTAIATSIGLVVGALAALSFKTTITEGMQLEQALDSIQAVMQYSFVDKDPTGKLGVNIDALNNKMRELDFITVKLGADTVFSNTEVAQTIEFLIRGGVNANMVSEDMVRAVLNLSTATGATLEMSSGAVNDLIGMWGIAASEIPKLANMIAGAVNTSRMDVPDFVNAIRQVGPLASSMGISPEEVTTSLALLGQKGFRGEIAGTAFRNMLLYINPRSKPAQRAMEERGLWVNEGVTPGNAEDPEYQAAVQKFNQTQTERRARLATLYQRLSEQRSSGAATSTLMSTQNQIDALINDINTAVMPKPKAKASGEGHSIFYDNQGNLKPMSEIIDILAQTGSKLNDQETAEFYQDVFGTRSGAAALLFSKEDAAAFKRTQEIISAVDVQTLANFKLDNVAGAVELLTGSLQSLAGVVFINWIASPLKDFIMFLDSKADVLLDFMGRKVEPNSELAALFGPQARGKMAIDQLFKELATGNIEAFIGNLRAIVPEVMRFESAIRTGFRALQLIRDGFLTFRQAFGGNWAGQATRSINGLIRVIGIFGLYWGNIWRSVVRLLRGEISFTEFFKGLGDNFFTLIRNLGLTLSISGPVVWQAFKTMLGGLGKIGETLWTEVAQPGMAYLWSELQKWWQANGPAFKQEVGSFFGGAFQFFTRRRVLMDTTVDEQGNTQELFSDPGAIDYLLDFFKLANGVFEKQISPVLDSMWNGAKEWLKTNEDPIKDFGKSMASLIGTAFNGMWADDGLGMGRSIAHGLQRIFTELGAGAIEASKFDLWGNFTEMLNGGQPKLKGSGKDGAMTLGDEFTKVFVVMALSIIYVLALIIQTFLNLIVTAIKEVIKTLGALFLGLFMLIVKGMELLPGDMGWIKGAKEFLTTGYEGWMQGVDAIPPISFFPGMSGQDFRNYVSPPQPTTTRTPLPGEATNGNGQPLFATPGNFPNGGGPTAGMPGTPGYVAPETYGIVPPQFVNPGGGAEPGAPPGNFQLVMGPDGPMWIPKHTTPGTKDIPSTFNPNDPNNWRENHALDQAAANRVAAIETINAYGLGVDEFLDEVLARLEARYAGTA